MTVDSALEYQKESDQQVHQGQVKNLSATGLMFIADEDLAVDDELIVKLTPVNDITPPMTASVRVIRSDEHAAGQFHVACEILKIN